MRVVGVTQEEIADAAGNISYRYIVTLEDSDLGYFGVVTVDGGPDWADRAIAAAQEEANSVTRVSGALG